MLIDREMALNLIDKSKDIEEVKNRIKNMPICMKDEYTLQHMAGKCLIQNCNDLSMDCPVDIKLSKIICNNNKDYLILNVSYIKDGYAEIGIEINDTVSEFLKSLFWK